VSLRTQRLSPHSVSRPEKTRDSAGFWAIGIPQADQRLRIPSANDAIGQVYLCCQVGRFAFAVRCQNSAERLRGPSVVVVQHPAEPFAALDATNNGGRASPIVDQPIVDSLVIPRAASHDILDSKRCSCNALKIQGISEPPHPPASISRYVPDGSPPLSTDLRLPNPRGNLRIRRPGSLSRSEHPSINHSKLDSPWHD